MGLYQPGQRCKVAMGEDPRLRIGAIVREGQGPGARIYRVLDDCGPLPDGGRQWILEFLIKSERPGGEPLEGGIWWLLPGGDLPHPIMGEGEHDEAEWSLIVD